MTEESTEGTVDEQARAKRLRHDQAFEKLVQELSAMAAPYLKCKEGYKEMTKWGFHPQLAKQCKQLGAILGVDIERDQNAEFAKGELECFRGIYAIPASELENFSEEQNGLYYQCYCELIGEMVAGVADEHEDMLIVTPHLDKTWHRILPYISSDMQRKEDAKFYRHFWLAVAYGMIKLADDNEYQVLRAKHGGTTDYETPEDVLYNGAPIGRIDIVKLLAALRQDSVFLQQAAKLEEKFKAECEALVDYESTAFLRGTVTGAGRRKDENGEAVKLTEGGLATKQDTNALTMIVRYKNNPRHSEDVLISLIHGVEDLCAELVGNKYVSDATDKVENRKFALCKRIYDASALRDKDIEQIAAWKKAPTK